MPQTINTSVENSFIQGLKTEFTGLNFPENAAVDTDNCVYSLIGDVTRRLGFDFEDNFRFVGVQLGEKAISSYRWLNAGGDGLTQLLVLQVGNFLFFYESSNATIANPLSNTRLSSTVTLIGADPTVECQFTDGNGYLFIFHPSIDPQYCTFTNGTITANTITLQIRDFMGIVEPGVGTNTRSSTITNEHQYNLQNQGWTQGTAWTGISTTSVTIGTGSQTFTIQTGLTIPTNHPQVSIYSTFNGVTTLNMSANVTSYNSGTGSLVVSVFAINGAGTFNNWTIIPTNTGFINTFFTQVGAYPSNSDIWWLFKDTTDVFNPGTTVGNVTASSGPAPKGAYVLNAFSQTRTGISGISGLTNITTTKRPRTGTWYQGRVWYTGVDSSQAATGDAQFYTWTENIYFSQVVTNVSQFGMCYQNNDPTDENFSDLLPTDGGIIVIQGSGSIFKLFPIHNGVLVFAANGIWFITGSQGLGFTANDYTVTKISAVQSISGTSFINVLGNPVFWNEEGIYSVSPARQGTPYEFGGFSVENLCIGTILTYYNTIPLQSKKFARGDYNPIDFVIQWCFKSIDETDVTSRYQFDKILALNTHNKAFYPYSFQNIGPWISDVKYIVGPGGSTSPDPMFKYITYVAVPGSSFFGVTMAEENNTNYEDWSSSGISQTFTSYFITGYKLHGKTLFKWQPLYVNLYSRTETATSYTIQGIWDYATIGDSGKYSTLQVITNTLSNFGYKFRRHKIRGRGMSVQFKVSSVDGQPFDIIGWSTYDTINQGM